MSNVADAGFAAVSTGPQGFQTRAFQHGVKVFLASVLKRRLKAEAADGKRNVVVVDQRLEIFFDVTDRLLSGATGELQVFLDNSSHPWTVFGASIFEQGSTFGQCVGDNRIRMAMAHPVLVFQERNELHVLRWVAATHKGFPL